MSTYASRLRGRLDLRSVPQFGQTKTSPPGWVLEKIYMEKLKGGYTTTKQNLCSVCYTYKSDNGSCNC